MSISQVPFLSVGSDIGNRTTRHSGNSAVSGDYVVEDVELDAHTYRRLIFLDNKNVIQSEARLVKGTIVKKKITFHLQYCIQL